MELNIGPTSNVRITNNTIAGSRYGGIIGGQGWSQLTVAANVIEGVGGDGMVFMDCQRFRIVDNQISGAIHGVGLHIDGSSNNGFVSGNIVAGNAIGIGVTGTSGTSGAILLMGNFSFDNADNHDVEISPSGDKVHTVMNVFGSEFHWEL
jgi:nitrous oxidase accessory protein NosD